MLTALEQAYKTFGRPEQTAMVDRSGDAGTMSWSTAPASAEAPVRDEQWLLQKGDHHMRGTMVLAVGCMTVILAILAGGARESSSLVKWEYQIVSFAELSGTVALGEMAGKIQSVPEMEALNNDMARRMTDLGRQGWELVCVQNNYNYVFKRKMP
jgi:hypothetical protein